MPPPTSPAEAPAARPARAPSISPAVLLRLAALLALVFAGLHALGGRDGTSFLSGTLPPGGLPRLYAGLAYVVFSFAAVIAAPVLAIAGALFALAAATLSGRRPPVPPPASRAP